MARKNKRTQIIQDSPFFNFPAEIREQIYYAALCRSTPIDLWPMKYSQDSSTGLILRLQEDLDFVRKEMATGLLTTCKQIFYEASGIFWSKNTFRFSGDLYWFGARRFLGQIGPRALSQLQSLELFAPLLDMGCLDTSSVGDGIYGNALNAKNTPKMHMVKARAEPWTRLSHRQRRRFRFSTWQYGRNLEKSRSMLMTNVDHVCYLLELAKTSLELKLVLPGGFGLMRPPERQRSGPHWGLPRRSTLSTDFQLPQELLRIIPMFTESVTLVLEGGALLKSLEMPEQFTSRGIDFLCHPGSIFNHDPTLPAIEIFEEMIWTVPYNAGLQYLDGVTALFEGAQRHFEESQKRSVPALGGRATKTPGIRSTARVLKGFGGCRFIDRSNCNCPHTGKWDSVNRSWETCWFWLNQAGNSPCAEHKELVIKKKGRAARNGVINMVG